MRSKRKQILVSRDQHIGGRDLGQCKKVVVAGVAANFTDLRGTMQFGAPQEVGNFRGVTFVDKSRDSGASHNIQKLINQVWRGDDRQTTSVDRGRDLAPPALEQGADQDRRVEDRADSDFS